jgi:hypothetical protein
MASATVARSSTRQKSNRAPLGSVIVSTVSGLTGSPFRANVRAEAGGFCILKGQPRHYVKTGDSGAKRIHAFCEVCASPIYSCAIENPQSYTQRTGLYCNGMSLGRPVRQIWTKWRLPWIAPLAHVRAGV